MRANNEIRTQSKGKGVYLWEIADKLGIVDASFSRKLRHELPQEEKERIFKIIDEIATEKAATAPSATAAPLSQAV
jgi:hypothetical protein